MPQPKKYNIMIKVKGEKKYCYFSSDNYKAVEQVLDTIYRKMNTLRFVPVRTTPKFHFVNVEDIHSLTLEDCYEQLISIPEED